ncbi:MAG: hypothetical protein LBN29_07925 [Mediterranea sp.]|jgi:hypothetical protein|nr:hypothetical protein [Mediterranea sp.]
MKKKLFSLCMFACVLVAFTACKDDKNEPTTDIAAEAAGTYAGKMDVNVSVAGQNIMSVFDLPQQVYVSKSGTNALKLEIRNFSLGEALNIGTITLDPCAMSESGNGYDFTANQTLTLQGIGDCPTNLTGNIDKRGNIYLDINVTATVGGMPQSITVEFGGSKS